jgi:opacity protein-like surface antigen
MTAASPSKMSSSTKIAAMVAAGAGTAGMPVAAQDTPEKLDLGVTVKIEGGAVAADYADKLGLAETVLTDAFGANNVTSSSGIGVYGSVGVSRAFDQNWDWSVSASGYHVPDKVVSGSIPASSATVSADAGAWSSMIDMDIGRNWEIKNAKVRMGVGVEQARAYQNKGFGLEQDIAPTAPATGHVTVGRTFSGLGPRISASVSQPINAAGTLSVIGNMGIASLHGSSNLIASASGNFLASTILSQSSVDASVMSYSGMIGLAYDVSPTMQVSGGYRMQVFDNASTDFIFDQQIKMQAAFVGMQVKF